MTSGSECMVYVKRQIFINKPLNWNRLNHVSIHNCTDGQIDPPILSIKKQLQSLPSKIILFQEISLNFDYHIKKTTFVNFLQTPSHVQCIFYPSTIFFKDFKIHHATAHSKFEESQTDALKCKFSQSERLNFSNF